MTRKEEIIQAAQQAEKEVGFIQIVKDTKGVNSAYGIGFLEGAKWADNNLWKDAQGDNLPEINREVVVLVKSLPKHEDSLLKVSFAHRPPEYCEGRSVGTGKIIRYEPKRYDKGGWNQPNVVYW